MKNLFLFLVSMLLCLGTVSAQQHAGGRNTQKVNAPRGAVDQLDKQFQGTFKATNGATLVIDKNTVAAKRSTFQGSSISDSKGNTFENLHLVKGELQANLQDGEGGDGETVILTVDREGSLQVNSASSGKILFIYGKAK